MKADLIMLNVSYKTMAKAMAARIKFSLTRIVCREQLGLLQGLSIHEAFSNKSYALHKVDFEKPFDLTIGCSQGFGTSLVGWWRSYSLMLQPLFPLMVLPIWIYKSAQVSKVMSLRSLPSCISF